MEDCNMLAADCIVISCCCQCLILQTIVFVLLKFPCKLIRKTKEFAKKKFRERKKGNERRESLKRSLQDEFVEFQEGSIRIQVLEEIHGEHSCMEEVERALEEFSQKGEFAFGSFWGRKEGSRRSSSCSVQEFDLSVVHFELVEIVDSFTYSY